MHAMVDDGIGVLISAHGRRTYEVRVTLNSLASRERINEAPSQANGGEVPIVATVHSTSFVLHVHAFRHHRPHSYAL